MHKESIVYKRHTSNQLQHALEKGRCVFWQPTCTLAVINKITGPGVPMAGHDGKGKTGMKGETGGRF